MPNQEKFVARCAEHEVEVEGPVGYLEHRREEHEGVDFTLVWGRRRSGDRGLTIDGVVRLLRRALRRGGGQ